MAWVAEQGQRAKDPHVAPGLEHVVERSLSWKLGYSVRRRPEDLVEGAIEFLSRQVCREPSCLISQWAVHRGGFLSLPNDMIRPVRDSERCCTLLS
jgi:hypothetical protein